MEIKNYKVFEFDELNEQAQKTALEELRGLEDPYWYSLIEEQWQEKLKELGYLEPDISFTGFWSQGDGASFTARVDLNKWLENKPKKIRMLFSNMLRQIADSDNSEIEAIIKRDSGSRYVHEMSCYANVEISGETTEEGWKLASELEKTIEADRLALSKQMYKEFKAEYEYLKSDEVLRDESNTIHHKFLESGKFAPTI